MRSIAVAFTVCFALMISGCGSHPTTPSTVAPPPQSGAQTATVSGLVFEGTAQGERPVPAAEFEVHTVDGSFPLLGRVSADDEGRYMLSNVTRGTRIALSLVSALRSGVGQQCAASAMVEADTVLDVELGSTYPSARLSRSPTVSGLIFERTAAGPRPIPNAGVSYDWDCGDGNPEASIVTDASGRYELCRLPRPLRGGSCVDVSTRDGRFASVRVDPQGDLQLDIEVPASQKVSAYPRTILPWNRLAHHENNPAIGHWR